MHLYEEAFILVANRLSKRVVALLAILVMLMPLLAACGGAQAPEPNQQDQGADPTQANQVAGDVTQPPAGTEPAEGPTQGATGDGTAIPAPTAADNATDETPAATGASAQVGGDCPEGQKGGTAVVSIQQEPDILDPFITGMTFSVWILHALDTPLVRATDKSGVFQPMLLTEVPTTDNGGISKDGLTYKVNFREGLKWSDGQPITARDLVFTWKTIMNPAYGAGSQLGWDKIQSIDLSNNDLTATIKLKEVYAPFFATAIAGSGATTGGMLLPEHAFKGMQPAQYAKSGYGAAGKAGHVSSGPFKMEAWKKGESITLARNENYVGQKACLDRLVFSVVPSVDAGTAALQKGDVDLATNYYASDIPVLEKLSGQGVKVLAYPAYLVERYVFNLQDPKDPNITTNPKQAKPHPVLGDKAVRQAISISINRPAIVEKLLYGKAELAVTEWDNSPWFNQNLKPYPFDPNQAKQILDQAGWKPGADGIREKNGVRLSFTHSTTSGNPIRETIQRAAISDLRNVGIEMKIQNYEPAKLFASFSEGGVMSRRQFDVAGYTTGIGLDPDFSSYYASNEIPTKAKPGGSNYGGYSNPEVDKLWAQQAKEADTAKRKAMYDRIQELMYNDYAILWIYDRLQIDAAGPDFQAPPPDFTGYIWWAPERMTRQQQ